MAEGFTLNQISGSSNNIKSYSIEDIVSANQGVSLEDVQEPIISQSSFSLEDVATQQEKQYDWDPPSEQLNIDFVNEHPLFEKTGGFDVRYIPDFETVEDASAWYGLPVEKLKSVVQEPSIDAELYQEVDFSKKFIPNLERDPKYERDGSIIPWDEFKSDWSLVSEATDLIWADELGIDKKSVEEIESPFWKGFVGSPLVMGTTDVADAALRTIATTIYGGAAAIGDAVTNITGKEQEGANAMRALVALFESSLPLQMGTGGAAVRSWGNTKSQVKTYNKKAKELIDTYVETTFKDSPNKIKIKNELNKKFDEGMIKPNSVIKRIEHNLKETLFDPRKEYRNWEIYDDLGKDSRFKKTTDEAKTSFDVVEKPSKMWQFSESPILSGIDRIFSVFRSRGNRTPQMQRSYETFSANVRTNNHRAISLSKKLERAINTVVKKAARVERKPLKTRILNDIQEVMVGNKTADILDITIQPVVKEARNLIDTLSTHLLTTRNLDATIKTIIEKNIGSYLRQSYKTFETKGYKPTKEARKNAFDYIREQDSTLTDAQINGVIDHLLHKSPNRNIFNIYETLPAKEKSLFLKKKDIPQQIKNLIGDIKDPRANLINTINNLTKWVASDKYFNSIKKAGVNKYFFPKPEGRFHAKIEGNRFSPLDGWYTSPEIANIIKGVDVTAMPSAWNFYKPFLFLKGVSQTMKTVFNHVTQIRNVVGGAWMTAYNGINPFSKTGFNALRTVIHDIAKLSDEAFILKYEEYLQAGIVRTSVKGRELQAIFKDIEGFKSFDNIVGYLQDKILKVPLKIAEKFQDVYMGVDDIFKIIVYENELRTLTKAFPKTNISKLKQMASEITVNTMPTYDKVPTSIKVVRRLPIGNFISFPAEIIRISFNSLKQGLYEIRTPNLKSRGAKRIAGNIAFGTLGVKVLVDQAQEYWGVTKEERDALRDYVAEWSKNSSLLITNFDPDKGKIEYIDLSYTFPYDIIQRPIQAIFNAIADGSIDSKDTNQIIVDAALGAMNEFFKPFISESIITQKFIDIRRNQTSEGRQVYNPELPLGDRIMQRFVHVAEAIEPGSVPQIEKLFKAVKGEKEPYGKEYDLGVELWANLGGLRITQLNIEEAFNFKVYPFIENVRDSERLFRTVANNQNIVPVGEYVGAYMEAETARYRNFSEMYKYIQSALELGGDKRSIITSLRDKGVSKKVINSLFMGVYVPYYPSDATLLRIKKSGNIYPRKEINKIYNSIKRVPLNDFITFNSNLEKGIINE